MGVGQRGVRGAYEGRDAEEVNGQGCFFVFVHDARVAKCFVGEEFLRRWM